MVFITCATRAVLCFFMARTINSAPPEGLLIFPLAFGMLVMSKSYSIAKSALVPAVVRNREELVNANSRLALISVVAGFVGGAPAVVVYKLSGDNAAWSLGLATIVFIVAAALAWQIPKAEKVDEPLNETEKEELHAPSIILAGSAMALLRGGVGFLTFFLAFALRDAGEPAWFFGLVIAGSAIGNFLGNLVAPQFRKLTREEIILAGSILTPAVLCLLLTRTEGGFGLLASGFIVGFGAALGRVAFDSLLQRDAPDAVRGRAFARFETRFQLTWVVGALLPVAIAPIYEEPRLGLFIIAIVLGFGGLSYLAGMRGAAAAVERRQQRADRAKAVVGEHARRWFRRSPKASGPPAPPPTPSGPPPAARPVEPAPARAPADPQEPFPGS
jgi:hypothetical protein